MEILNKTLNKNSRNDVGLLHWIFSMFLENITERNRVILIIN